MAFFGCRKVVSARQPEFQKLMIFSVFSHITLTQKKQNKKKISRGSMGINDLLMREVREKKTRLFHTETNSMVSQITTIQRMMKISGKQEKILRMHTVLNLEADRLQHHQVPSPVIQERESETTVDTGSPKPDR